MPTLTLTFANEVNTSLQAKSAVVASGQNTTNYGESIANDVGGWDNIYFVRNNGTEVIYLGTCTSISSDRKTVTVTYTSNIRTPVDNDFILFANVTVVYNLYLRWPGPRETPSQNIFLGCPVRERKHLIV